MAGNNARLGALVSAPPAAPKPPRSRPNLQGVRRVIRNARWAASLMTKQRFGAWCVWAFLAAAPAGVAIWLLVSEISFAGYKAGRGVILMLFGLTALTVARRRDLVNDIEDTFERHRRA